MRACPRRSASSATAGMLCLLVALAGVAPDTAAVAAPTAAGRLGAVSVPTVSHLRTIATTPFQGSAVSMKDHEGSAYVPRDNSLWLSDDEGRRVYEVNARTGALKRMVTAKRLAAVTRLRGDRTAGRARTRDLESVAYDAKHDRLYVFSGSDCKPSTATCRWRSLPTAFRLARVGGRLRPVSFQPLAPRTQTSGAAWHPGSAQLYVGEGPAVRAYNYRRSSFGPALALPGPHAVFGLAFSKNGRALFVVHGEHARISRLSWPARSLQWSTDLSGIGVRDARGVARVGRRLFVSDGYDHRPAGSRLRYAVFVLRLG
jgi:hypothetical protein